MGIAMTIEDLLSEIADRGWYLYSLRNTGDKRSNPWECYIRDAAAETIGYGQGPSAYLAISAAIERHEIAAEKHALPTVTLHNGHNAEPSSILSDALSRLLNRNKPAFIKRI